VSTEQENAEQAVPEPPERQPDWWHRDHPTFTALTGFFTGLVFVILVPGLFAAALGLIFEYHTAEDLFPFVLVTLVVPLGLVIAPRTRRFGQYMLIGMLATAIVVGGVAAVVLWYMVNYQS
jgi:4-amino-4-deoxy-L-arabinose transferase-like glycosyltransferase